MSHRREISGESSRDERGVIEALLGDGHFLLALTGVALAGSGGFALFLCLTGHFLPHDVAHLGMDAKQLALVSNPQLVNFMFHDRAAFGGALLSMGALYLWLVAFPLRRGEAWAWWTLAVSGGTGFGSFLTYLAYGYLDQWHGVATLCLLPIYVAGMAKAWSRLPQERGVGTFLRKRRFVEEGRTGLLGRRLLLLYGGGLVAAGIVISITGMTQVFVMTDLRYIGMTRLEICGVSNRLVPLIAHDRAGFGGGLLSIGIVILAVVFHAPATRSFKQVMLFAGGTGFATAIGVHFIIGYLDVLHIAPAFAGLAIFLAGWALTSFAPGGADTREPFSLETKKADAL
ncbi:hypothetical protein [Rariglobus hedericola]|uniref:hypothetical protein n=1 Tax=Rariglobus hedericola TaxID=2597822 RepID=UPI00193A73C4|nr:hypothetical protein [Rariglobus hedericola]